MSPENIIQISESLVNIDPYFFSAPTWIAVAVTSLLCLVFALYGFKLFRLAVILSGALVGYTVGSVELPLLIGDTIKLNNNGLVLGIVCAVLLSLLAIKLLKLVIFISAFFGAYVSGGFLSYLFLDGIEVSAAKNIISFAITIAYAIVIAYLTCRFFKYIYIVYCAIGGMIGFIFTAMLPLEAIKTGILYDVSSVLTVIGLVLGVLAAIRQFKRSSHISF